MTSFMFHVADYVVFALTLLVSLAIGVYFAVVDRRKNTTEDYLLGGRKLGLISVAISMCVSVVSSNTFLGAPAELYTFGIHYELMIFTIPIAILIVAAFLVPVYYPLRLTSKNRYLYLRYNSLSVLWIGTAQSLLAQGMYVGCIMYGPSTTLEAVTGIPVWASILVVSLIGIIYTTVGGIRAVIWTDVFQSVIMVSGLVAIIIRGSLLVGGFGEVWRINKEQGRLYVNTGFGPYERYTLWTVMLGGTVLMTGLYGVNQPSVQRFVALDTMAKARWSLALNAPGLAMFSTLATMAGMTMFGFYYSRGCDPLRAGYIKNSNQLIAHFVSEVFAFPGLPGLFIASLFSAVLSSLSSSLNAMAAVVWEDVLDRKYGHLPAARRTAITKALVAIFGVICMSLGIMISVIGGNVLQISYTLDGVAGGAHIGIFVLGMLVPWANWIGAVIGAVVSMAMTGWLAFGQLFNKIQRQQLDTPIDGCIAPAVNATSSMWTTGIDDVTTASMTTMASGDGDIGGLTKMYSIAFILFAVIGLAVCLSIGIVVSCITGKGKMEDIDPMLLFPCLRGCYSRRKPGMERKKLPEDSLRLGVKDDIRGTENASVNDGEMTSL